MISLQSFPSKFRWNRCTHYEVQALIKLPNNSLVNEGEGTRANNGAVSVVSWSGSELGRSLNSVQSLRNSWVLLGQLKRIDDGFRSTLPLTAMNQWEREGRGGKKREEKKETIDRRITFADDHRTDARESAKWQSGREWYGERFICVSTVVYRGVSRAFVTCLGGISPHSARNGSRLRALSWLLLVLHTYLKQRGKKDIVKICSVARWEVE